MVCVKNNWPTSTHTGACNQKNMFSKQNEFPDRELNPGLAGESRLS